MPTPRIPPRCDHVATWQGITLPSGYCARCGAGPDVVSGHHAIEAELTHLQANTDRLQQDLDRLALQIERLLRERTQIQIALSAFSRAELSISSVQPILRLAESLDPTLTRPARPTQTALRLQLAAEEPR